MSIETTTVELPRCSRCRAHYRPSSFDRTYLCAVCGHSLNGRLPRTRKPISPVWFYGGAAVLLGIGVTALAARSLADRNRDSIEPRVVVDRQLNASELPHGFASLVDDKIRILRKEAERSPNDPVAISALADAYTYRALIARDAPEDQVLMRESLAKVKGYIERLEEGSPQAAEQLRRRVLAFDQLVFLDRPSGSAAAQAWRLQVGREILPRESGVRTLESNESAGVSVGAGRPLGTATPSTGAMASGPTGPTGGGVSAPNPRAGRRLASGSAQSGMIPPPAPAASQAGGGTPMTPQPMAAPSSEAVASASGMAARMLPPGGSSAGGAVDSGGVAVASASVYSPGGTPDQVNRLRSRLRLHPDDSSTADRLGRILQVNGSSYLPSREPDAIQRSCKQSLQEAAKVYAEAAKHARLEIERAAFYDAASDVYRQLEEWDSQFQMLRAATKHAPFASGLWRKLEKAALRQGEMEICQTARQNAAKWAFPAIGLPASLETAGGIR